MGIWVKPRSVFRHREALKGEDQLQWVGGFSSRSSLLLLPCHSLVPVLRVILLAVCIPDGVFVASCLATCFCDLSRVFSCADCFGSGERVILRPDDGRMVEVAARVASRD